MMNFYDFVDECRAQGMTADEALDEWNEAVYEREQAAIERYENDPIVWDGWAQQDVIDMYRRER